MDDLTVVPSGPRRPGKIYFFLAIGIAVGLFGGLALDGNAGALKSFFSDAFYLAGASISDAFGTGERWHLSAEVDLSASSGDSVLSLEKEGDSEEKSASSLGKEISEKKSPAAQPKNSLVSAREGGILPGSLPEPNLSAPKARESKEVQAVALKTQEIQKVSELKKEPCNFQTAGAPSRRALFYEIAWMGSLPRVGESAGSTASNEWIEIKNASGDNIDLSGWQIANESGDLHIAFGAKNLPPSAFFLFERTDEDSASGVTADGVYTGSLSNAGEWLKLFDEACALVDEFNASAGWPGGDNTTKQTFERNRNNFEWHTSVPPGGTPRAENSEPAAPALPQNPPAASSSVIGLKHQISVSIQGGGLGEVSSLPTGINCGFDCLEEYADGTTVVLTASPSADSTFDGWSGVCNGAGSCNIRVSEVTSVVAHFRLISSPPGGGASQEPPTSVVVTPFLIAEVQISGASTTDDLVRIFNPLSTPSNLKGYRLVKRAKTSTGDTPLKSWTADTFIPANGYYLWANSSFVAIPEIPDAATSGSIANDNGIAIRFGPEDTGILIDSVAWGEAANNFVEGSAYPTNPEANQKLLRKTSGGGLQDTNNNSADFEIR